jgi:hypothetical protein
MKFCKSNIFFLFHLAQFYVVENLPIPLLSRYLHRAVTCNSFCKTNSLHITTHMHEISALVHNILLYFYKIFFTAF